MLPIDEFLIVMNRRVTIPENQKPRFEPDRRLLQLFDAERVGNSMEVGRLLFQTPDPVDADDQPDPDDEPGAAAGSASSSGGIAPPFYAGGVAPPSPSRAPDRAEPTAADLQAAADRPPEAPAAPPTIDRALGLMSDVDRSLADRQSNYEFLQDRGYPTQTLPDTIAEREALAEARRQLEARAQPPPVDPQIFTDYAQRYNTPAPEPLEQLTPAQDQPIFQPIPPYNPNQSLSQPPREQPLDRPKPP